MARESDSMSLDNQMARIDRIENEDRRPTTDMGLSGSNQEMDNSITQPQNLNADLTINNG